MYLQKNKLNTKNVVERGSLCNFETAIIKEIFSLLTFFSHSSLESDKIKVHPSSY